jgi:hypothetical protein
MITIIIFIDTLKFASLPQQMFLHTEIIGVYSYLTILISSLSLHIAR